MRNFYSKTNNNLMQGWQT